MPPAWKARVRYVSLFDDLGVQGEIASIRLAQWLDEAGLAAPGQPAPPGGCLCAPAICSRRAFGDQEAGDAQARRPRESRAPAGDVESVVNKYSDGSDLVDPGSHVAFYGRMSLGPGQRFAVRGGAASCAMPRLESTSWSGRVSASCPEPRITPGLSARTRLVCPAWAASLAFGAGDCLGESFGGFTIDTSSIS